ncbi:MAG: histidine phosphatase family protein [Erysipelotrichaceae bacterium]|nr:histidine phosphatase family protein [Erysipelotrichaceae bacterium]
MNNPLNEEGIKQVTEVGLILKEKDPNWDVIIASPLNRAIHSARIIANELNYTGEIIINNDVIERDFGKAEGCLICEEIYDKIKRDDVENLEKSYELQNRAFNAILKIANTYKGKKILIATHSHFIKGLFTKISNEFTFTSPLYNASRNYVYIKDNQITKYIFNLND